MVDSISDYLFAPSDDAVSNLKSENLSAKYMGNVGNIMIDTLEKNLEKILKSSDQIKEKLSITANILLSQYIGHQTCQMKI